MLINLAESNQHQDTTVRLAKGFIRQVMGDRESNAVDQAAEYHSGKGVDGGFIYRGRADTPNEVSNLTCAARCREGFEVVDPFCPSRVDSSGVGVVHVELLCQEGGIRVSRVFARQCVNGVFESCHRQQVLRARYCLPDINLGG